MPKSKITQPRSEGTVNTTANVQIGFSRPELQKKHVKIQGARSTIKRPRSVLNQLAEALAPKYSVKASYEDLWTTVVNPFFLNQMKWDHNTLNAKKDIYKDGIKVQQHCMPMKKLTSNSVFTGTLLPSSGLIEGYNDWSELHAKTPTSYGSVELSNDAIDKSTISGGNMIDIAGGLQGIHCFWLNDKHTRRERQAKSHEVGEESYNRHVLVQDASKKTFCYQDPDSYGLNMLNDSGVETSADALMRYKNPEYELHHDSMEVTYNNTCNETVFVEFVEYQPVFGATGPLEYYDDFLCQLQQPDTGLVAFPEQDAIVGSNPVTPSVGHAFYDQADPTRVLYEMIPSNFTFPTMYHLNYAHTDPSGQAFYAQNTTYNSPVSTSDALPVNIGTEYTGYKAIITLTPSSTDVANHHFVTGTVSIALLKDPSVQEKDRILITPGTEFTILSTDDSGVRSFLYNGANYAVSFLHKRSLIVRYNPFNKYEVQPNCVLPRARGPIGLPFNCLEPRTAEVNLPTLTARNYYGAVGYLDTGTIGYQDDIANAAAGHIGPDLDPNHFNGLSAIQLGPTVDTQLVTDIDPESPFTGLSCVSVPLCEGTKEGVNKLTSLGVDLAATVGTFCHRTLQQDGTYPRLKDATEPSFRPINMLSISGNMHPTSDLKWRLDALGVNDSNGNKKSGQLTRCATHDARMCLPNLANEWVKLWQQDLVDEQNARKSQGTNVRPFAESGDGDPATMDVTSPSYNALMDNARAKFLLQGQRPTGAAFNAKYRKRKTTRVCIEPGSSISYQFFSVPGIEGESRLLNGDLPDKVKSGVTQSGIGTEVVEPDGKSCFFDERSRVLMVYINGQPAIAPRGSQNQQTSSPCSLSLTVKTMERVRCLPKMFSNSRQFAHSIDQVSERHSFKDGEFAQVGPDGVTMQFHADAEDLRVKKFANSRYGLARIAEKHDHQNVAGNAPANITPQRIDRQTMETYKATISAPTLNTKAGLPTPLTDVIQEL